MRTPVPNKTTPNLIRPPWHVAAFCAEERHSEADPERLDSAEPNGISRAGGAAGPSACSVSQDATEQGAQGLREEREEACKGACTWSNHSLPKQGRGRTRHDRRGHRWNDFIHGASLRHEEADWHPDKLAFQNLCGSPPTTRGGSCQDVALSAKAPSAIGDSLDGDS